MISCKAMTKILYGDSECFREGEKWLQETSSDIFSSRWFFLFSFWKSRSCKLIPNLTRKCMITYKNKYFGQNPWSYKMFFCYVNWTKCHSLRWYGTLKYGGFHEKFNFLKIQDLRPLNTCQKHFEMILPNFPLDECGI